MNIFLIGFRCSGKTSVGQKLARQMDKTFVDTDTDLVEKFGKSIAEIVEERGWPYFRKLEKKIIHQVCRRQNQIVATGGGVVLDAANVDAMEKSGILVWLQADVETTWKRMTEDLNTKDQRPALTYKGMLDEIDITISNRKQYYSNSSNFTIATDSRSINEICNLIREHLLRMKGGI